LNDKGEVKGQPINYVTKGEGGSMNVLKNDCSMITVGGGVDNVAAHTSSTGTGEQDSKNDKSFVT